MTRLQKSHRKKKKGLGLDPLNYMAASLIRNPSTGSPSKKEEEETWNIPASEASFPSCRCLFWGFPREMGGWVGK